MKLILTDDFEKVRSAYIDVSEHTPDIDIFARWVYGKHPYDELLKAYIHNREMYIYTDGENIAGMVAVTMYQGQDYESVEWAGKLRNDEVAVLHLLAVCPEYQGRSLGKAIIRETEALVRSSGKKALRLDVLSSNLPAQRMYESEGFEYMGKQHLYAENTGWTDFLFYEKVLKSKQGRKI